MAKGDKEELTTEEIKTRALHKMLESLISGDSDAAEEHLHTYLQLKTQELILGEKCKDEDEDEDEDDDDDDDEDKKESKKKDDDEDEDKKEKVEEQTRQSAFANSGSVMSDAIKGDIKYKNGGKKTLKKHGNAPKELDDDNVGKTKFKSGGKQPAKVLEPTPKPDKFNDGRDFDLGTLDEGLLDEIYEIVLEEKPSAGLSKEEKSSMVKKAKKGEDIGKKGKNFQKVVSKAKEYGAKNPEAVAAAAMWKNAKR